MKTEKQLKIRRLVVTDLPRIQKLICMTIDKCYKGRLFDYVVAYLKRFHSRENILAVAEKGYTVVVERDGKIVATGSLIEGVILRVYVDPNCQKQGIGKLIMKVLEKRALQEGYDEVILRATEISWQYYQLMGYTIVEKNYVAVEKDARLEYYKMEKRLGERAVPALNKGYELKEDRWIII